MHTNLLQAFDESVAAMRLDLVKRDDQTGRYVLLVLSTLHGLLVLDATGTDLLNLANYCTELSKYQIVLLNEQLAKAGKHVKHHYPKAG